MLIIKRILISAMIAVSIYGTIASIGGILI